MSHRPATSPLAQRLAATATRVIGAPVAAFEFAHDGEPMPYLAADWQRGSCWMFVDARWSDAEAAEHLAGWIKANWGGFAAARDMVA